jgi:transcriptional regulator with XRE-family HTH domain
MAGNVNMTPEQQIALDLQEQGYTRAQIASQMGISEHAVKRRLAGARKWQKMDPEIASRLQAKGYTDVAGLHSGWLIDKDKNGAGESLYFFLGRDEEQKQDIAELLRETLTNIPKYEPVHVPRTEDNRLTVYPLVDAHFGMRAWGKETGGPDYDLAHAESDIKMAFSRLWSDMQVTDDALLILGGDTLHTDDNEGHTQSRSHVVDTDGRLYKVTEVAIRSICWIIDGLLKRHSKVTVRVLRGNHDPHAHIALHFALSARYGDIVVPAERDIYWYRHGVSLIAAHHGDKGNAKDLCMVVSDTCPEWSATRDRHVFTGHIHHDSIKDFPGVKWWSLKAFCPPDEYGSRFGGKRALQGIIFDAKRGFKTQEVEGVVRDETS